MKRIFGEEVAPEEVDDDVSIFPQPKRPRPLVSALRGVMGTQCMQRHLPKLEPFVRRVVQEEVEKALFRFLNSVPREPINRIQARACRRYRLRFLNSMPHTLFTGSRIEAEGKVSVQVVITDTANSNKTVTFGPFSSVKIEILVLDGDFCGDHQGEWTEKEFVDSLVREREGKRPLLTGEVLLTLCNGVAYLGDVTFTDNSSWIRSRKFRLGARLHQSRCTEVQEAISEAFLVKDHRGELYKKHHPPSLNDDVWRLEKIGKDGAFHRRLAENGISTVQDFLKNFVMDQERLRNILGNGMSNKIWEATLEHAKECVLDEKLYSYCRGQEVVLLFNSIFELVGAMFDNKCLPLVDLTADQKVVVNKLKPLAYKNPDHIIELNLPVMDTLPRPPLPMPQASSVCEATSEPQLPKLQQDETATHLGLLNNAHAQCNQLLDPFQPKDYLTGLDFHSSPGFGPSQVNSFNMRNFLDTQLLDFQPGGFGGPVMNSDHLMGYNSNIDSMTPSPLSTLWGHENGLVNAPGEYGEGYVTRMPGVALPSSSGKWVKVLAALKWMALSKQRVAGKARTMDLGYPMLASNQ